jgi:hypothetical protein
LSTSTHTFQDSISIRPGRPWALVWIIFMWKFISFLLSLHSSRKTDCSTDFQELPSTFLVFFSLVYPF